jgi:HD-like signal output (HDOD) protein
MPASTSAAEPALAVSIRPLLHEKLAHLFDQANPCLPALERTCQKILSLAGGATGADQLAHLISRDPGLICKVLQVANSIAYSPQHVISSVPHAVTWLGLDTVRSIVTVTQLVEQLHEWPDRQQVVSGVIGRALMAAVHANELGVAVKHASLSHLFSSTMLYAIGDLAIAYQAPDLYQSLRRVSGTTKARPAQIIEETTLLGVPKLRLAKALAQMWALPDYVVELFSFEMESMEGRWQSSRHTFNGLVIGSAALIEAMTGPGSRPAIEQATRPLLTGTGLPSHIFGDILVRALDRGKQLVRSSGLTWDQWGDHTNSTADGTIPLTPLQETACAAEALPVPPGPSAIETNPLETLQTLQTSLQAAKDLNAMLGILARTLHRDGGFARVGLALLNPNDTDQLIGRLVLGVDPTASYLQSLSGSLSHDHPSFLSLLKQLDPRLIDDFGSSARPPLDPAFLDLWKPNSAIVAPLRIGTRPIGMLYCDRGPFPHKVQPLDYQGFQLFFGQAMLAMNRLAGVL